MHILVQATPMDADGITYIVECSECGPVWLAEGPTINTSCREHMAEHGATSVVSDGPEDDLGN